MKKLHYISLLFLCLLLIACSDGDKEVARSYPSDTSNIKIFEDVPSSQSGINFSNTITETEQFNSVTFDGMLQGAGVGILDVNNDGLQDIYFASNMEGDKLYLNEGNFKFKDITKEAGIKAQNWSTGVAIVDINNDGFDDIYVCKFMYDQENRRHNVFYLNKGDGTFVEQAKALGIADSGYSIMANFFDYDRDGDLDLYVANQPPNSLQLKGQLKGKRDLRFTDRLYKNNGGRFVDVTKSSGMENYSYSLSATTIDFNKDGWPDLYVACDYDEADFFYKNNGNGTFTNVANESLKHMSNFSMGVDVADINNDGHLDLFVADMVAEDNFRQKTNMSGMNPQRFYALAQAGYHYQYMFNSLQLNNGDETFSEVAQLSGVSNTDWSWSPLFIDADQDGYKDLFVTNGLMREMRNKDFEKWRDNLFKQKMKEAEQSASKQLYLNPMEIVNKAPSIKIANFGYKNNGDLSFTKVSDQWGIGKKNWSQGAAYADFDNDGDLDMVFNNMNMPADLYRNTANDKGLHNYIVIDLVGPTLNKSGINASIEVVTGDKIQNYEFTPYRGYMSCSELIAHFGLGESEMIDEIRVKWADNKMNVLTNVKANQKLTIKHSETTQSVKRGLKNESLFRNSPANDIVHIENNHDDYLDQILLPYRTSTLGPAVAKGDVNGDGAEDIFIGGSAGQESKVYIHKGGRLVPSSSLGDSKIEVGGAEFFDADGDGDLDLYVASGGSEFNEGSSNYQDKIYTNNGQGKFTLKTTVATITQSTSAVMPVDYDSDGDFDIIVCGRQIPSKYGKPATSYVLQNNNGKFKNVTLDVAPFFKDFGMVTDVALADMNKDGKEELVIAGEWMALRIFDLGTKLNEVTNQYGLTKTKGWWNTIEIADIDNDGDNDIVAGNLGHNIKYKASPSEPFKVYVDDFDKNGTNDVYLGYYENGQCFPVRGRQCSSQQLPFVSEKFPSYKDFGLATIDKVLEDHLSPTTTVQEAHTFSSTIFLNENGQFKSVVLPNEVQIAPVYGIAIDDYDKDGKNDIFLAGNMYQREVETTRSDAGKGCLLTYEADGTITVKRTAETGVSADKDVRSIETLKGASSNLLVIANNNDALQVYQY